MSLKSFEKYRVLASLADATDTEIAGRYNFQAPAERRIVMDVVTKLSIESNNSLLEIGCGPGNLLIPLSYLVAQSAGIDNSTALERLAARAGSENQIHTYIGDFLTMELPKEKFDKILIYSVLQYLSSTEEVERFVSRALSLLETGGRLLLGDLPNRDKKQRFINSPSGEAAAAEWQGLISNAGAHPMSGLPIDDQLVDMDDNLILTLLRLGRELGFESYLLQQPPDLPFGNTREDVLFIAAK